MTHRALTATGIEGCPYRRVLVAGGRAATATCGLLAQLLGEGRDEWSVVEAGVCESCCRSSPPTAREPNPVVASLLYARASRLAASWPPGGEAERLESVAAMARERLD